MTVTKEMIEAALEAYAEGVYLTDEQVFASVTRIVEAALSFIPYRSAEAGKPVAHLVWRQYRRAADDVEDYYEVARRGDKSIDGSDPFPVWASPLSALSTPADIEPVAARWLVEETLPSGSVVWEAVEHEHHARTIASRNPENVTVTPLYRSSASVADREPVSVPEGAEPVAYASSKEWRKNHLMSAAQYKSALSKNIVDFDIPLYAAADFDRVIAAILADETPVGADDENVALFNRAIDAAKKRVERAVYAAPPQPNPSTDATIERMTKALEIASDQILSMYRTWIADDYTAMPPENSLPGRAYHACVAALAAQGDLP